MTPLLGEAYRLNQRQERRRCGPVGELWAARQTLPLVVRGSPKARTTSVQGTNSPISNLSITSEVSASANAIDRVPLPTTASCSGTEIPESEGRPVRCLIDALALARASRIRYQVGSAGDACRPELRFTAVYDFYRDVRNSAFSSAAAGRNVLEKVFIA